MSLDEAAGCYQVGEPASTDPTYILSFTVVAAAGLLPLIDTTKPAAFCFRYVVYNILLVVVAARLLPLIDTAKPAAFCFR